MRFVSFFIPTTVQKKAGLRTKRRMPFILGTNILGLSVALGSTVYVLINSGISFLSMILLGTSVLFAAAISLSRKGKFAAGAYLCTISLVLICTCVPFLIPSMTGLQILYRLTIAYLTIGTLNLISAIRRRQLLGFCVGSIALLITFFMLNLSINDMVQLRILSLCIGGILVNTAAHFLIYLLNEGIYQLSHTQTVEAKQSLEKMKELVENVKDSVEFSVTLGDASDRLDAAVTGMQDVYQYLQNQSDNWEKISDGLKRSFDTILEKMQDMTDMLGKQNSSINQSSSVLSSISNHIGNVDSIASQRRDSMYSFVKKYEIQTEQIKELINTVELLRSSSQGIMSFTHAVENIASQTGVLAMNASIEASHAGQFGKGFGVIAQEIRTLSGETTKTARKIAEMLGENNKIVQTVVTAFDNFAEETQRQINEANVIINSIESIMAAVTEVGKGTEKAMQTAVLMEQTATETHTRIDIISDEIGEQRTSVTEFAGFLASINAQIQSFMEGINHIKAASASVAETGMKNRKIVGNINTSLRKVYGPVRIPWHDSYKVGIDTIDAQHHHLFEIADILYSAITSDTPPTKAAVKSLLDQCADYVKLHFSHEEDLMAATTYPASAGHKTAHVAFTAAVMNVIKDFSEGKEIDLEELYAFISDWLVEHIIRVDRSLGTYLNKCGYCANAAQCKKDNSCKTSHQ